MRVFRYPNIDYAITKLVNASVHAKGKKLLGAESLHVCVFLEIKYNVSRSLNRRKVGGQKINFRRLEISMMKKAHTVDRK